MPGLVDHDFDDDRALNAGLLSQRWINRLDVLDLDRTRNRTAGAIEQARVALRRLRVDARGRRRRCREEQLTYGQTSDLGVFAEIGEGCVDWPALFGFWRDVGYGGAVIVETDRTTKSTAKESATISRRYLRDVAGV